MQLKLIKPLKSLNKAYYKESVKRSDIESLKEGLKSLYSRIDENESEEHLKNIIADFLKIAIYQGKYEINTRNRIDLAIHNGKSSKDSVGVIIETKRPLSTEKITKENFNTKSLHELILYYFEERNECSNIQVKNLIATNIYEWFVFDENEFDKIFFRNSKLQKLYNVKKEQNKDNPFFYAEAEKIIDDIEDEINCTYFNLKDYEEAALNEDSTDDNSLIVLYKILSPEHLLKLPFTNDSNSLNKEFYNELLYILGLEEYKEGGKKLISRAKEENRNEGSLLENTIYILQSEGCISNVPNSEQYGETEEERTFSIALELCINWLNRILFLKLLEGQLVRYNRNENFSFLNFSTIGDYDELNELFFGVLAVKPEARIKSAIQKFGNVPYLNSSLFERTELEDKTVRINSLRDRLEIPIYKHTILKDTSGCRISANKKTLLYLFEFLDAYDFASESRAQIQEQNKSIINASVLGLIFEKINGYKDGSFFTPGFITMYMCRETLRRTVIQKFNENYNWTIEEFSDLKDKIDFTDKTQRQKANELINSLKICDPAVGSGHFLVSALNELIAIKSELGVLQLRDSSRVKGYKITIENDELIIINEETDEIFGYILNQNRKPITELQALQEAIFHEKQTIIENCLFGVDINPKSVMICRLRLWIELLKNAYYTKESNYTELETLPNIDINIKCGNSLISRFSLDADLSKALKSIKYDIKAYRGFVSDYKNAHNKEEKKGLEKIINSIKSDFRSEIYKNDPKVIRLNKLGGELYNLLNQKHLYELSEKEQQLQKKQQEKFELEINKLTIEIEEIKSNAFYRNAFEWRFEFPEVLNEQGEFVGFNVVIGNPPYIRQEEITSIKFYLQQNSKIFNSISDIYTYFIEKGSFILNVHGFLSFIISNKFSQANYGKQLRAFLQERTTIYEFIDLSGIPVFDSATVDAAILSFSKQKSENCSIIHTNATNEIAKIGILEYLKANGKLYSLRNLNTERWTFQDNTTLDLKEKIRKQGKPLKDWKIEINYGIKTGLNEAFFINEETKENLLKEDPNSKDIIKYLARGRDIEPYFTPLDSQYLLFVPWHFPLHKDKKIEGASIKAEEAFKMNYPAVYNHLLKFKTKLQSRNKAETGIRYEWFALQRCANTYYEEILKPKIVYPNMTKYWPFTFDESGAFINDKIFIITGENLKYLLAILNSKLFKYTFKEHFPELLGGTRELRKVFMENCEIKECTITLSNLIEELVDKIIYNKKNNIDLKTRELESKIDGLVYELYGLNEEEIKIIESAVN